MLHEVFDQQRKEWIEISDAELATYEVIPQRRYSEFQIDMAQVRALAAKERRMTEEECEDAALEERIAILEQMWENIGKSPQEEEKRMINYLRMLKRIPNGLLSLAVDRAMFDNGKFLTVPTPGAIVAALHKELGNPYDLTEAITRWQEGLWYRACLLSSEGTQPAEEKQVLFFEAEVYA